jgi:hypothetical protein
VTTRPCGTATVRNRWLWLLLIPIVVPLLTPLYGRIDPKLGGVPFFYWCQLAFIALGVTVTAVVYHATKQRDRSGSPGPADA